MAKNESTAVNELIELMTTQKPLPKDPSEDLMFSAPKKVSMPRTTSSAPQGTGEVAPLPRARAPQGTQRGVPAIPSSPAAVRMSTAPLSRTMTIPPIAPPPIARRPFAPSDSARQTKPTLPPPRPSSPRQTMHSSVPPVPAARPIAPPPMPSVPPAIAGPSALQMMPIVAPFESKPSIPTMPFVPAPPISAPLAYPSAQPYLAHLPTDMTSNQEWFDQHGFDVEQQDIGTARVQKRADWKVFVPKLIAPMIGLVIVGVFVGGFFAFDGQGGKPASTTAVTHLPAPTASPKSTPEPAAVATAPAIQPAAVATEPAVAATEPAKPEPAAVAPVVTEPAKAEPTKAEAITPPNLVGTTSEPTKTEPAPAITKAVVAPEAGRPAFVDIRIDSKPTGATVMLVDRGKTTFLGTTPISTSVDPARTYDLVFTYANKPTQLEHIDPSTTTRIAVVLGKPGNHAVKAALPVVKTETPKTEKPLAVKVAKLEKPAKLEVAKLDKVEAPKAVKADKPAKLVKPARADVADPFADKKLAEPAGEGVLMISSKPPCEIYVDGTPTGLTTPQRAIKLAAGKHKITLVNATEKIKKTISVQIAAEQPTKVIQDLMK